MKKAKKYDLEGNGEFKTLPQICRERGLVDGTIRHRINTGMSIKEALALPINKRQSENAKKGVKRQMKMSEAEIKRYREIPLEELLDEILKKGPHM